MEDNTDDLKELVNKPKSASGDSGSVTLPSIDEQIRLDRYIQSKKAQAANRLGFKMLKFIPSSGE